ncbi:WGR domain protein [Leptospira weilii serovar Ranarum str. ICFT]|uniref:WGR domain protein n=1 Tax=Leptospira weilii serovar Ranarum str. ICFT TaxID=1218598 RepID=N1WUJ6_9LEPT|nr:WGR domain-containing protein [Leptospira weilii]EMY79523.1 WGR domain protein [Leptospira weilii serovar Ranarum str. ICFT]
MKHHLTYQDKTSNKFWQAECFGNTLVITEGQVGLNRKIEIKTFSHEKETSAEVETLWNEKLKEGYKKPSGLSESEEDELFRRIKKESDFHNRVEIAESGLSEISDKNRKKLLKQLIEDCDCVLMGLGTADGDEYDGEDEFYPEMIQEETGLSPVEARNVYNLKFSEYKSQLKSS